MTNSHLEEFMQQSYFIQPSNASRKGYDYAPCAKEICIQSEKATLARGSSFTVGEKSDFRRFLPPASRSSGDILWSSVFRSDSSGIFWADYPPCGRDVWGCGLLLIWLRMSFSLLDSFLCNFGARMMPIPLSSSQNCHQTVTLPFIRPFPKKSTQKFFC